MSLGDILNLVLIVVLVTFSICIIFITYFLIKALKSITNLLSSMQNTTEDIRQKLQMRFISLIPSLVLGIIGRFLKKRG